MNVKELIQSLETNEKSSLRFVLPSGQSIPGHFHITEVGKVGKDFIDCGGTRRSSTSCVLQAWTAADIDHRLGAGKLAKILRLAEPMLGSPELPVEVEYGPDVMSHYYLSDIEIGTNELRFYLVGKQTDCLAKDKCGVNGCNTSGCC